MKKLTSHTDLSTPESLKRRKYNLSLLEELRTRLEKVTRGGTDKAREKHTQRGKLLVRDRINLLLDPNTPFMELSPMAAWEQYDDQFPSAGLVTGIAADGLPPRP